jgi:hypothetical protein
MVKKLFTLFLLGLFCMTASAGDRYLVRIGADGKQEAIPLKKGQRAQDVIERLENAKASLLKNSNSAGLIDTLKYFPNDASLTSNFGYTHQDVAFQWYTPAAGGRVKELWWYNYQVRGNLKKGTVRAWLVNSKLATRPTSVLTKHFGYYKDPTDGDGLVTPFKPKTGDTWFYGNGAADSATYNFDPLGTEVTTWVPGGYQFTLDSAKWQGIKLEDWGDSMFVKLGEMFGFTLSNDTKLSDIPSGGTDERMEMLSFPNTASAPYHSFKWYEQGRTVGVDKGWHMRGDYEWGMYTVIEYTTDRAPKVVVPVYSTTLKTTARAITATITDDNPGGGAAGISAAFLKFKKGTLASYDSVAMTATGSSYTANAPAAAIGDTVYWFISTKDVNNNYTILSARSYKIFKKTQDRLFIYNNAQYSIGSGALIYLSSSTKYDRWSAPNDGTGELADLLALYDKVVVADGSFPSRNVYPALNTWIATGTATAKKNLFLSSQDYGCYITPACGDTTFSVGAFEQKYLGVTTLGPQDQGSTNRPVKVVPVADTLTNYIIKYNTDSSTTFWHYPTFELAFSAYPDFMTPTATAKAIFKDAAGTNVYGVKNSGTGFNTVFLALDAGALQFRSDTSLHNATYSTVTDPKYNWIVDVKSLANVFMDAVTSVQPVSEVVPGQFTLGQNYPNPFNPSTVIEYNVPVRSNVEITIFNILGQKVATIINDVHDAGTHRATWNGKDSFGKTVASGIYFYQMNAGSFEQVKKMMLMK